MICQKNNFRQRQLLFAYIETLVKDLFKFTIDNEQLKFQFDKLKYNVYNSK